jgi:hypothetical protein
MKEIQKVFQPISALSDRHTLPNEIIQELIKSKKSKAIPVTGRGGL